MRKKTTKKWTLVFLLSAKNNLFMEQLNVINEIYSVGTNNDVNLVIILDGLEGDKFSPMMEKPTIFYANNKTDFLKDHYYYILNRKNASLNNTDHLKILLRFVVKNFKADKYGFFYKGHGGPGETDLSNGMFDTKMVYVDAKWRDRRIEKEYKGKQRGWTYQGFCEYPAIRKNNRKQKPVLLLYSRKADNSFSYKKLATVLKEVFKKSLAFVCMDCCWAQQIENAFNFIGVTDYFIASADEMPALGLGYTQLCTQFVSRPQISPEEAANLIVAINYSQNYDDYDSDIAEFRKMGISMTSVCLKEYQLFLKPFKRLCKILTNEMKNSDRYTYKVFQAARRNCLDYTYHDTDHMALSNVDYLMFNIDLVWLLENLLYYNTNDEMDQLLQEIVYNLRNNFIIGYMGNNYKKTVPGQRAVGGKGISICFPKNSEFSKSSMLVSKQMRFYETSGWKELLNSYYSCKPNRKFKNKLESDLIKKFFIKTAEKKPSKSLKEERLVCISATKKRRKKKQG